MAEPWWGPATTNAGSVIVYSLVALAVALRLAYYFLNPTLSTDEAQLALNLRHQPYTSLVETLDFNQAAPVGFLVTQKLLIGAVGDSEYGLRLFPLVSALLASVIFYPVASRLVGRSAARLALVPFAVSELLLVYAATTKQYSSDVTITIMLYGLVLCGNDTLSKRRSVVWALGGLFAIVFSNAAVFVLAGIASVLIFESVLARQWRRTLRLALIGAAWLASAVTVYLLTHASYTNLQQSVAGNAAVLGITDTWNDESRAKVYGGTVRALLGIPHLAFGLRNALALIASLLCLVGFTALLLRHRARALLLISPAAFAVLVSVFGRYPLFPRTLLFLVPALLMVLAYGVQSLMRQPMRPMRILTVIGFGIVVTAAAIAPANHLSRHRGDELKETMVLVAENQLPSESLYIYATAQYDIRYYLECGCFADRSTVQRARALWPLWPAPGGVDQTSPAMRSVPPRLVVGTTTGDVPSEYRSDFARLMGRPRVWIVIAAASPKSRRALMAFLDEIGTRKKSFRADDDIAAAHLYDLSG